MIIHWQNDKLLWRLARSSHEVTKIISFSAQIKNANKTGHDT